MNQNFDHNSVEYGGCCGATNNCCGNPNENNSVSNDGCCQRQSVCCLNGNQLKHFVPTPQIGVAAPSFSAKAFFKGSIEQHFSSEDLKGKWILLFFYPLDFTFVCPTELFELGALRSEFEKRNCQILGVSVDSVFSHQSWAESVKKIADLGFPLLSDLNKEISIAYNVLHQDGMSLRGAFFIDPNGILQSFTVNNLNVGRSGKELLRTLKALQTGELCQAGWTEGEETLGKA